MELISFPEILQFFVIVKYLNTFCKKLLNLIVIVLFIYDIY